METTGDRKQGCLLGAFFGDALAMPVHWYYDRAALVRDYGRVVDLVAPKNPHADSILWRSNYAALNAKGEILHDQATRPPLARQFDRASPFRRIHRGGGLC
jgi:ADP-ribosylglycohydrolase